jgi:threonine/homoserine/homoserine lactone efflux protein
LPTLTTFALFAVAALILTASPGPAILYVLARTIGQGRRAGIASMLGIEAGELLWIMAAATGLAAVLATSTSALGFLRIAGAAYLIVLGIRRWLQVGTLATTEAASAGRIFGQGLVTQLLNPKVAIFFVAFLPQFLDAARPIGPQVIALGIVYLAVALVTDTTYVLAAAAISRRFLNGRVRQMRMARASAATYLVLGLAAAASSNRATS